YVLLACRLVMVVFVFFFSSRRRHTRSYGDWSSDVCSSDLFLDLDLRGARPFVPGRPAAARVHAAGEGLVRVGRPGPSESLRQERSEERRVGKECGGWAAWRPTR